MSLTLTPKSAAVVREAARLALEVIEAWQEALRRHIDSMEPR